MRTAKTKPRRNSGVVWNNSAPWSLCPIRLVDRLLVQCMYDKTSTSKHHNLAPVHKSHIGHSNNMRTVTQGHVRFFECSDQRYWAIYRRTPACFQEVAVVQMNHSGSCLPCLFWHRYAAYQTRSDNASPPMLRGRGLWHKPTMRVDVVHCCYLKVTHCVGYGMVCLYIVCGSYF